MNISLKMPSQDQCDQCVLFKETIKKMQEDQARHDDHIQHAERAFREYRNDASQNTHAFSMDLQKVQLLPIIPGSKETVFTSRLVSFNQTFAPIVKKSGKHSQCVLWHEGQQGRNLKTWPARLSNSSTSIETYKKLFCGVTIVLAKTKIGPCSLHLCNS